MKKSVKIISLIMAVMLFVTTFTSANLVSAGRADGFQQCRGEGIELISQVEGAVHIEQVKADAPDKGGLVHGVLLYFIEYRAIVSRKIGICNP